MAFTVKKPLVVTNGEEQVIQATDLLVDADTTRAYNDNFQGANGEAGSLVLGDICYLTVSPFSIKKAKANAALTIFNLCFATGTVTSSSIGIFQIYGWLYGLSGLTSGAIYYLSATTAGVITTTPPSTAGQYVIRVGVATGTTSLFIKIESPILLAA